MKVGHAVGLSFTDLGGGKFRLYWRQWEQQPDGGRKRVQRTVTAYSVEERRRLEAEIERALQKPGWWTPGPEAARPVASNLEMIAVAWIDWKVGIRRVSKGTRTNLAASMGRFFRALRKHRRLAPDAIVPSSAIDEVAIVAIAKKWSTEYAETTAYQTLRAVWDMWTWAADSGQYELPRPPLRPDRILPRPPVLEAPEAVPTFAECDAVIRRIEHPVARTLAILMRYTGLRIEQASYIYREDLDFDGRTLVVRKGKSRREQALMRRVQAPAALFEDLGQAIRDRPAGPLFPDHAARDAKGQPLPMVGYRNQTRYVTRAWEAATEVGEARMEAWSPPNRRQSRPDHAFRAAIQGELDAHGVPESVLDHLVGHASSTTRGRHYTAPAAATQRRAVDCIPPIDWQDARETNLVRINPRWRK